MDSLVKLDITRWVYSGNAPSLSKTGVHIASVRDGQSLIRCNMAPNKPHEAIDWLRNHNVALLFSEEQIGGTAAWVGEHRYYLLIPEDLVVMFKLKWM